jgi:hypothetical protein
MSLLRVFGALLFIGRCDCLGERGKSQDLTGNLSCEEWKRAAEAEAKEIEAVSNYKVERDLESDEKIGFAGENGSRNSLRVKKKGKSSAPHSCAQAMGGPDCGAHKGLRCSVPRSAHGG